jgi:hypothetical protein
MKRSETNRNIGRYVINKSLIVHHNRLFVIFMPFKWRQKTASRTGRFRMAKNHSQTHSQASLNAQKIHFQSVFYWRLKNPGYPGAKSHFFRSEKIFKFFWLQLVPGTTIQKKHFKT